MLLLSTLLGNLRPKNEKSARIAASTRHFVTSGAERCITLQRESEHTYMHVVVEYNGFKCTRICMLLWNTTCLNAHEYACCSGIQRVSKHTNACWMMRVWLYVCIHVYASVAVCMYTRVCEYGCCRRTSAQETVTRREKCRRRLTYESTIKLVESFCRVSAAKKCHARADGAACGAAGGN